jgi:hypothetical protein
MYCANCGTPINQELSYCNRCGASLREREEHKSTAAISAFLTAITLLGLGGLGIMLGGAVVLRQGAALSQDLIGVFMLFSFLIVGITETMLVRQLSRLMGKSEMRTVIPAAEKIPIAIRQAQPLPLSEPIGSVTDNTTRTLEFSRRQQ